jgi:hypothetical protein
MEHMDTHPSPSRSPVARQLQKASVMATHLAGQDATVQLVATLIGVDLNAIEAYRAAIERIGNAGTTRQLRAFLADHARHVEQLSGISVALGSKPPEHGDLLRLLTKGRVLFGNFAGDRGILAAMGVNEDYTRAAYERAIVQPGLTRELRKLLIQNLLDEHKHRGFVSDRLASALKLAPQYETV